MTPLQLTSISLWAGRRVDLLEAAGDQDAGVVDQHVEPVAVGLCEFAYPLVHFVVVGDVEVAGEDRAARAADLVGQCRQADVVDVVSTDGVALGSERQRCLATDAGGGAGDEHALGHLSP